METKKMQHTSLLVLLFAATAFFLWMLGSYLFPVFWAIVIAVIFHPVYRWLTEIFQGHKNIPSLLTILITIVVIVIPLLTISGLVVRESISIYNSVASGITDETMEKTVEKINQYAPIDIDLPYIESRVREMSSSGLKVISASLLEYSQLTFDFLIKVIITGYLMFFLLRFDKDILDKTKEYLPINKKHLDILFERFYITTQAILRGTLIIAILQGSLGGLLLWAVGFPAPLLWAVAMTILSVIPVVGPPLILVPAGIFLILSGSVFQGILTILLGVTLIALIDEFLRPILVGRKARIPDALVLLAMIGGIATFGISGFVIGPILAAFCLSLWKIFGEETK